MAASPSSEFPDVQELAQEGFCFDADVGRKEFRVVNGTPYWTILTSWLLLAPLAPAQALDPAE
jgi:hypothetical protein